MFGIVKSCEHKDAFLEYLFFPQNFSTEERCRKENIRTLSTDHFSYNAGGAVGP